MKIALLSESANPTLDRGTLERIASAVSRQLYEDYADLWEARGSDVFVVGALHEVPQGACIVAILDDADQAGALGYHDTTPDGRPYARVFLGPILADGGTFTQGPISLSVTVSHEVLEIVGDPYVNWWADMPGGNQLAQELCDPVEGDSYEIGDVSVSNFVGPRYFSNGPGPYDRLGLLGLPWTMTAGGYMIVRGPDGEIQQVFGAAYPEWKKAGKEHAAARTARRRAKR